MRSATASRYSASACLVTPWSGEETGRGGVGRTAAERTAAGSGPGWRKGPLLRGGAGEDGRRPRLAPAVVAVAGRRSSSAQGPGQLSRAPDREGQRRAGRSSARTRSRSPGACCAQVTLSGTVLLEV